MPRIKLSTTSDPSSRNSAGLNPLTLEQVRALEEGRELAASDARSSREVLNYFAGLRYVEKHAMKKVIRHEDLFELHRILADSVMDQGTAGSYPQDIFDFVVIDECHRGGANDESNSPRG